MEVFRKRLSVAKKATFIVPAVGCVLWGLWSWQRAWDERVRYATESAQVVARYVESMLDGQELLLATIFERAKGQPADFLESGAFHDFLAGTNRANPIGISIGVIDDEGRFAASSMIAHPEGQTGERDYRTAIKQGKERFVDRILIQPTNEDALILARPFRIDGFSGIIISAARVDNLAQFLIGMTNATDEAAAVARLDGKILVGTTVPGTFQLPATAPALVSAQERPQGTYTVKSVTDGVWRMGAHVNLPHYDLSAFFSVPLRTMWFTWFWSALPVWMLLIASASFSNVLFRLLERQVDDRIGLLSERKRAEEAEKLSAQRTHLMREMSHRVKNNLTLVASMINLQSRKHGLIDGPTISARIQAIAQVHELLYDSASGMDVSFGTTLKKLSASDAVIPPERGIRVECFIDEDVTLTPDVSTVLSIAVAELLTNSVKHAFPGEDGSLSLRLGRDGNKVVLDVWDDGTGLPEAQERSSGLTLVDALIAQAGGSIERLPPPGARFRIRFPAPGST